MIVGKIDVEGPSRRGDVTIEKSFELNEAIQTMTDEVENEPLPMEHKEHVREYYRKIRGEGSDGN